MLCVILLFCAHVIMGQGAFVSPYPNTVTLFPLTQSTSFVAHNYLDGKYFLQMKVGDVIVYIDDDTNTGGYYKVTEIVGGQASDPKSPYTNVLIDGQWMTPEQVWRRVGYLDPDKLVLQTCIEKDGNSKWGRLFVIAEPVEVSP